MSKKDDIAKLKAECLHLMTQRTELRQKLEESEEHWYSQGLEAGTAAMQKQVEGLEAERDKLWKETLRLTDERDKLHDYLTKREDELEGARSYIEHLETAGDVTECDELQDECDEYVEELLQVRAERDRLRENVAYWQKDSKAARKEVAEEKRNVEAVARVRDEAYQQRDKYEDLYRQTKEERDKWHQSRDRWHDQAQQFEADRSYLYKERDELQNDLALLVQERDLLEDELTLLEEQRDESRKKLVHTVNPGGKFNEKMRAAIVDALWDEGGAFDQLSDAVKAAVLGDEQCECETCECKASEQEEAAPFKWDMESGTGSSVANWQDAVAHPYEYPVAMPPSEAGRMAQTREAQVWRYATGRIKDAYAKWQRSRTTERKRQFTHHMQEMRRLHPELQHTLSKDCWCNPTVEDFR